MSTAATGQGMFVTNPRKSLAIAVIAAALTLTGMSPASADTRWFGDRSFDTRAPADITRVTVRDDATVVVRVHHRDLRFDSGAPGALRIAYDTSRRFAGPEFYLRVHYQTDVAPELRTARGWGTLHSPPTACAGEQVLVSSVLDLTRVSVPASCLGNPDRLRVHVRLNPRPDDQRAPDVAPRSRTMGPWVNR